MDPFFPPYSTAQFATSPASQDIFIFGGVDPSTADPPSPCWSDEPGGMAPMSPLLPPSPGVHHALSGRAAGRQRRASSEVGIIEVRKRTQAARRHAAGSGIAQVHGRGHPGRDAATPLGAGSQPGRSAGMPSSSSSQPDRGDDMQPNPSTQLDRLDYQLLGSMRPDHLYTARSEQELVELGYPRAYRVAYKARIRRLDRLVARGLVTIDHGMEPVRGGAYVISAAGLAADALKKTADEVVKRAVNARRRRAGAAAHPAGHRQRAHNPPG